MNNKSFGAMPDFQSIGDFWRKHSQNLPGFGNLGIPAMSIQELDKRIADFKAVEAWLKLNTDLLHNGIQALEMQRQAFATFTQFAGERNAATPSGSSTDHASATHTEAHKHTPNAEQEPARNASMHVQDDLASAWWNVMQQQFEQMTHLAAQSFVAPVTTPFNSSTPSSSQPSTPAATATADAFPQAYADADEKRKESGPADVQGSEKNSPNQASIKSKPRTTKK